MEILDLKLRNFRNFRNLNIKFNKNKNIIIGNNGMGKTNLIEAIYVLGLTKSFRGTNENIIITKNENSTKIEGNINGNIKANYQITLSSNGKKAKINNKNQEKLSDYLSKINIILFNPDDLKIIKNSPSSRRKLLNIEISQLNNQYLKKLTEYNHILKQRNSYLKTMYINSFTSKEYLDILTDKLINLGIDIYNERKKFIDKINKLISNIFYEITDEKALVIKYNSCYKDITQEKIRKKYDEILEKDMMLGSTTFGIHHDDIDFLLNDDNLRDYGSEGQQKNAILSFKLAEVEIFNNQLGEYPILILDDLFSELDSKKINNILKFLNKDIQIFITVTDLKYVTDEIKENSNIIKINNGKVEE